ncbi:MAG: GIY-YIG nuclease family protein [Candidatus Zixiibacteriota bacterium]
MSSMWVYILRCSDGSYYTGSTSDLNKRLSQHQEGVFRGYTLSRRPVILVFSEMLPDERSAVEAEQQIEGWTHRKKSALIDGDFILLKELARCRNQTNFRNPPEVQHRRR